MKVVDGHQSGWHSAPLHVWRAVLRLLIAAGAKIVAFTECRILLEVDGWAQYAPAIEGGPTAAECSIAWDDATYEAVAKRWRWLTRKTFKTGTGHERPGVIATVVVLRERATGKPLVRIVFHPPASVQDGKRFSRDQVRRVAAWSDAVLRGFPQLVRELQAEFPDAEVVASADTNVNLLMRVWRAMINTALAGTGMRVLAPESGTHHDRGIDGHATTMRRQRDPAAKRRRGRAARIASKVLNRRAPFDHRGVVAALVSRRRRRRGRR